MFNNEDAPRTIAGSNPAEQKHPLERHGIGPAAKRISREVRNAAYPLPKQLMGAGKIKFGHLRETKDLSRSQDAHITFLKPNLNPGPPPLARPKGRIDRSFSTTAPPNSSFGIGGPANLGIAALASPLQDKLGTEPLCPGFSWLPGEMRQLHGGPWVEAQVPAIYSALRASCLRRPVRLYQRVPAQTLSPLRSGRGWRRDKQEHAAGGNDREAARPPGTRVLRKTDPPGTLPRM